MSIKPDPKFEAFVEASEQAREIAEALLAGSHTYQQALKKREEAWLRCQEDGDAQAAY